MATTLMRSDGSAKVYGRTKQNELLTVVFRKDRDDRWTIKEIAVSGKLTYYEA